MLRYGRTHGSHEVKPGDQQLIEVIAPPYHARPPSNRCTATPVRWFMDIGSAYVRKEQMDIRISVSPDDIIYLYLTDEQWMLYGPMKRLFDITKDSFTNNEGSKDEEESRCECCTKCTKESTKTIQRLEM